MLTIQTFYPTSDSLETAKEPYRTVAAMINNFYKPNNFEEEPELSMKFKDFLAVSCIRDIAEDLAMHKITFVGRMRTLWNGLYDTRDLAHNSFKLYSVPNNLLCGLIFGGVYYVLHVESMVSEELQNTLNNYVRFKIRDEELYYYDKIFFAAMNSNMNNVATEDNEKKSKGLTAPQAALFCEALLRYHKCELPNKKDIIGPLGSQLFGLAKSTMERNTTEYGKEERIVVADIFKDIDPEFCAYIRSFGVKGT